MHSYSKSILLLLLAVSLSFFSARSQVLKKDTVFLNPKRLRAVVISEAAAFAASLYLLNNLWYKDYPRSSFHFFNDNKEWMQMDKIAHATNSCTIGALGYKTLRWCGVENKKAIWYGGSIGSVYLLTIEMLDAFSSEWGFSPGDFTANTLGSAIFVSQQFAWNDQRIKFIRSYHTTQFAQYRPDLLGDGLSQTWLKDYNGQTFWLSANIHSFLGKESRFPKWLNLAVGYGAEGMLGGYSNPSVHNGQPLPYFERYRQYYLSPDIAFTKIPTRSQFLKGVFYVLNMVKFPAPALEFSRNKCYFIPVYF